MVSDRLASIPFYHELLGALTRSQVLVLSAILYAARLHARGAWFFLTDQTIAQWTGLSRTTIWRCRRRLVALGLVEVDRLEMHLYCVSETCERNIMALAGETMQARDAKVYERMTPAARALAEAYCDRLDQRPRASWIGVFEAMARGGFTGEDVLGAIAALVRRGVRPTTPKALWGALVRAKRAAKKTRAKPQPQQPERQQYYRFTWTPEDGFIAIPLPPDATEHIYEETLLDYLGREESHGRNELSPT